MDEAAAACAVQSPHDDELPLTRHDTSRDDTQSCDRRGVRHHRASQESVRQSCRYQACDGRTDGRSCEHDAENDFGRLEPVRHKQDEQAEQAEGPGRARMKYSNSRR